MSSIDDMRRFLVIHGKGMENRGKTQIEIFGTMTLPEYDERIRAYAAELKVRVDIFHSNEVGETIAKLRASELAGAAGALINPAGYTRGFPTLVEAIANAALPTIEVHVSNPARRGNVSEITRACRGVIAGMGLHGYYLALEALKHIATQC